jgi:hypothetical protein
MCATRRDRLRGAVFSAAPCRARHPAVGRLAPLRTLKGSWALDKGQLEPWTRAAGKRYTHPSCCIVAASFQIFVMWLILPPLNFMSYT